MKYKYPPPSPSTFPSASVAYTKPLRLLLNSSLTKYQWLVPSRPLASQLVVSVIVELVLATVSSICVTGKAPRKQLAAKSARKTAAAVSKRIHSCLDLT